MSEKNMGEIGWSTMMFGWRLTIQTHRHIKIEHPTHRDLATMTLVMNKFSGPPSLKIEYEQPERVPRTLRTGIQVVFRRMVARHLQH